MARAKDVEALCGATERVITELERTCCPYDGRPVDEAKRLIKLLRMHNEANRRRGRYKRVTMRRDPNCVMCETGEEPGHEH